MRNRAKLSLVVAVLALVVGFVVSGSASASTATTWPGANYDHPYSSPIWFPIHTPILIGCAGTSTANNDSTRCSKDHVGYFAINFAVPKYLPDNKTLNPDPNPAVYSSGAGVVIKVVTGQTCNKTSSSVLPGNEVYVSHGGGIVTVYQHLASVSVKLYDYVSQLTVLGHMGATGAPCVNGAPAKPSYLDFQVRKWGGSAALTNNISWLLGCNPAGTAAESWPSTLTADQYYATKPTTLPTVWTQVPFDAGLVIDPAKWGCVAKTGGLGSLNRITTAKMTRNSSTAHTLSWTAVPKATAYNVQVQVKSGTSWTVPCSPFVTKGCTYGYFQVSPSSTPHLVINGAGTYRAMVEAYNGVGWSAPSAYLVTT